MHQFAGTEKRPATTGDRITRDATVQIIRVFMDENELESASSLSFMSDKLSLNTVLSIFCIEIVIITG